MSADKDMAAVQPAKIKTKAKEKAGQGVVRAAINNIHCVGAQTGTPHDATLPPRKPKAGKSDVT